LQSGRCTSPRTLHELSKLRDEQPETVHALIASNAPITRAALSTLRVKSKAVEPAAAEHAVKPFDKLVTRAHVACKHLERTLDRLEQAGTAEDVTGNLKALRQRVIALADRWPQGSDRQTPTT
jgi:ParB family transcriptional regulator, chromosome partitioning protein